MAPYYTQSEYSLGTLYLLKFQETEDRNYISKAINHLARAVANDPTNLPAVQNLAIIYTFYFGDKEKAKQVISEDIQKFPNYYVFYYYLAIIDYQLGDRESSIKDLENIYKLGAADSYIRGLRDALINNKKIDISGDQVTY